MTKDILGFEGLYTVSDSGEILSLGRTVPMPNGGTKTIWPHAPAVFLNKKGYVRVMLTNPTGIRRGHFVHRIVAATFLGESKLQVNHKDLNKQNNAASNLEYVTNRENSVHAFSGKQKSSKYVGVTKSRERWQAQKMIDGKRTYLGVFDTQELAHAAYQKA